MNLDNSGVAARRCRYNTGDYMMLVKLGMAFWYGLAAPVVADTLASMVMNWLNKRK